MNDAIRVRTDAERTAYVQGFETGARDALEQVRLLGFGDVAQRAKRQICMRLDLVTHVEERPRSGDSSRAER